MLNDELLHRLYDPPLEMIASGERRSAGAVLDCQGSVLSRTSTRRLPRPALLRRLRARSTWPRAGVRRAEEALRRRARQPAAARRVVGERRRVQR
ncbi:hypothetical protein HBB16_09075 [Pseudonocardia sp. MCCB 268]|nr:hypothetical protein [Pseudonocardia cytotoxica]